MVSRREKLEAMLEGSPADQMLRYMLALELEKEGECERSLQLFSSLMKDSVPYVPAFLMAGQQMARLDRIEDAKACYADGIQQAQAQNNSHAAGEMSGFLDAIS